MPPARADALTRLPVLSGRGAIEEARRLAAAPESHQVLRDLEDLIGRLGAYGVADVVRVDLSIIRDFEYYTGIVFEGHTSALGFALLGGGRYDRLFDGFGLPYPATGFAIRVDRVLAASPDADSVSGPDVAVVFANGDRAEALRLATALRERDLSVTVEVLDRPWEEVEEAAIAAGAPRVVLVAGGRAIVRERQGGKRTVPLVDLLEQVAGRDPSWPS